MKKKSHLTDDDRAVWKHATSIIEPHRKTEKHQKKRKYRVKEENADEVPALPPSTKTSHAAFKKKWHAVTHTPVAKPVSKAPAHDLPGIAADVFSNIKTKKRKIDARLDLHGMTQETAHRKAISFITQCYARHLRTVLVITGKGSASGSDGVLQKNLTRWLSANPETTKHISGITHAPRELGGSGAFVITLKKH